MYNLLASGKGSAVIDGNGNNLGQGASVSGVAIALVFGILGLIIIITFLANYLTNLKDKKTEVKAEEKAEPVVSAPVQKTVELDSEDAVAAVLVASIDYRNEIKKDIKVISVKEIK